MVGIKKYKIYFDKDDTPYVADWQAKKKYHTVWKRLPYKRYLGCEVAKIKLFGLFTIYKRSKEQNNDRE